MLIEPIEPRLLLASLANPLVNDPDVDLTGSDTQSETTTVAFESTVIVAYNDSGSAAINFQQRTGWSRSTDGGATFADMGRLPFDSDNSDGITGDAGDPVLARDNVSGRIYLSALARNGSGMQLFRSIDNGATLLPAVNAMPGFAATSGDGIDKPWTTVDNAAGAGQGTVYSVARVFAGGGTGSKPSGIYVARSSNGGDSFSPANSGAALALGVGVQGANVVVGTDHSVYVFWLDSSTLPLVIQMRKSTDGGSSFGPLITAATLTGNFIDGQLGMEFRSNSFPQAAVNPVGGQIYVTYNDNPAGSDRADVFLVQSSNGGTSWSAPLRVNTDATTNDQFFPTLAVTPDGSRLFLDWEDRRADPANTLIDLFGVTAGISGSTLNFGSNFRITNTSFAPVFGVDGSVNGTYRGDYETASATNSFFYCSWSDDRDMSLARSTGQQNVRSAHVPVSGAAGPMTIALRPSATTAAAVSSVQIDFNRAMDTSSFSLADIDSFTGPGGVNLLPQVTGFTWFDTDTLQINFNSQSTDGGYWMEVGPNIAAAGGPATMDQNVNGVAGENINDRVVISFTVAIHVGPDFFGYVAGVGTFQSIDLVTGQSGVVSILDGSEDITGSIPLGGNTFNFYGTSYTGSSVLFVTDNGHITFGGGSNAFTNGDLTDGPAQPTIAPLWDDWSVKLQGTGALTNSAVLYKFDTPNNRLIIEWSDVPHWQNNGTPPGSVTFQAILQLNTGSTPGTITFNYPDLDGGSSAINNGVSGTVGIKDTGTQGGRRLLISKDAPSLYVGSGKAITIVPGPGDTTPPKITAGSFAYQTTHAATFTFNENISPSLSASDFMVQNLTTASSLTMSRLALVYNGATNIATLSFPGVGDGPAPGILTDGNYRITLASAGVFDSAANALDGDGNGTPGPDYTLDFFVLSADANHDRKVDLTDFTILAANFNTSGKNFGQGNFNYDSSGVVDLTDFTILAAHFNQMLPAPPAGPSSFGVDTHGKNQINPGRSAHPVPAVLGFKNPASLKFLAALDSSDSDDPGDEDWFVG